MVEIVLVIMIVIGQWLLERCFTLTVTVLVSTAASALHVMSVATSAASPGPGGLHAEQGLESCIGAGKAEVCRAEC